PKDGRFGLPETLDPERTRTADEWVIGTPAYASPEQIRGRSVDFRSDIYSVGATLYALLAGKPPFEGQHAGELLGRILSEEPTPLSRHEVEVPAKINRIIGRCL